MKEKKNKGLIVLVVILAILVLGLGGFVVYDKVLIGINNTGEKTDNKEDNTEQPGNEESCKDIYETCIEDYNNYKSVHLSDLSQSGIMVIFKEAKEILRSKGPLCMISAQETVYFIYDLNIGNLERQGEIRIYNENLKYLTAGTDLKKNNNDMSPEYTYYFEPNVDGRIWVTDFNEVYEYDHNFVLKGKLSDKISLVIKNYEILGIANKYAFLVDKEGYLYAVDLHNYGAEKSSSIPKNKVSNNENEIGRYLNYLKCDGKLTIRINTLNDTYVEYVVNSGFNF